MTSPSDGPSVKETSVTSTSFDTRQSLYTGDGTSCAKRLAKGLRTGTHSPVRDPTTLE